MNVDDVSFPSYRRGRLPCSDMDEWHRFVSEIPQQKEITVITVSVALVLLSQSYTINSVHGRMSHDAKAGELDIYLLVCRKHFAETVDVVVLGMDGVCHLILSLYLIVICCSLYYIAHDDKCLVAKHLA